MLERQTDTELEQDTQGPLRVGEQAWSVVSGSQTSLRKARRGRPPWVQCESPSPFGSPPSPWSSVSRFLLFTAKEPSRRSQPPVSRGPFPSLQGHTHVPRPVPGSAAWTVRSSRTLARTSLSFSALSHFRHAIPFFVLASSLSPHCEPRASASLALKNSGEREMRSPKVHYRRGKKK